MSDLLRKWRHEVCGLFNSTSKTKKEKHTSKVSVNCRKQWRTDPLMASSIFDCILMYSSLSEEEAVETVCSCRHSLAERTQSTNSCRYNIHSIQDKTNTPYICGLRSDPFVRRAPKTYNRWPEKSIAGRHFKKTGSRRSSSSSQCTLDYMAWVDAFNLKNLQFMTRPDLTPV